MTGFGLLLNIPVNKNQHFLGVKGSYGVFVMCLAQGHFPLPVGESGFGFIIVFSFLLTYFLTSSCHPGQFLIQNLDCGYILEPAW